MGSLVGFGASTLQSYSRKVPPAHFHNQKPILGNRGISYVILRAYHYYYFVSISVFLPFYKSFGFIAHPLLYPNRSPHNPHSSSSHFCFLSISFLTALWDWVLFCWLFFLFLFRRDGENTGPFLHFLYFFFTGALYLFCHFHRHIAGGVSILYLLLLLLLLLLNYYYYHTSS